MNIPDEAAKIAGDAFMETLTDLRLNEGGGFKVVSQQRRAIRAALEAAAPILMAEAWDQCAEAYEGRRQEPGSSRKPPLVNPYRSVEVR